MADPHLTPEEANERLARQYADLAELAGGLAHEIKNPLSIISLNMELLAEDFDEVDTIAARRAQGKLVVMQQECQRLRDLLDDFLRFTKVHRPQLESTNLNAVVERVINLVRPQAEAAGIEIIMYLDAELPWVMMDGEAFHGAVLNLVLNAQQAMPDGGQLVVRTSEKPNWVALDLIDTGIGMDSKTLTRMFDAFFSTRDGGSGLGLPTTRKIIEAHGGRIDVESEVGRGTHFRVELPVPARLTLDL